MTKIRIAKIAGIAAGTALVFGSFVPMVGAVTIAELQAQINALMAQLAALQGGSVDTSPYTFTQNLTVGSTGADVTSLQQYLVGGSYLNMPIGVSYGYFGPLTKAAVAAWQAAHGVAPAVGYWGPISRAAYTAIAGTTVPGTTVPGSTVGSITTPGVEGTITVSINPSPASGVKLYEGESQKQVLGIKLEAKQSDIKVERIKVDLDSITNTGDNLLYTKIGEKIYVMDGSTVLASSDLNSSTVVKDGTDYFITLSGFSYVVPANSTRVLYIALDARASWDSTYDNDSWSLGIPVDGVRGVDGAGVNEYGPSTAFTRTFTSAADLVDSATLAVSLNSGSPATSQVICAEGTDEDECSYLEVAKLDFRATKDDVLITDFVLDIVRGGASVATSSTAYLYDGSTLVGSAAVAGTTATAMTATFADIDWTVPKDTTKTLSVKFDIIDAALAADTFVASTDAADITAENSAGTIVTASGSADGRTITIRNIGPEITLVSKSIVTSGVPQSDTSTNLSTSTLSATFNIKITAVGNALTFGTVSSTTPLFASSTASFKVYRNGAYDGTISSYSTSTSFSIENTCVSVGTNSCTLAEGAYVTVPVTFQIVGRSTSASLTRGSVYAVGFEGISWESGTDGGATQTTTFMAGESDWRTADVSFP